MQKLGPVDKESKSMFNLCPKCKMKAAKNIAKDIPNTTKGGKSLELFFCCHCKHQWFN